ncbi:MAG: Trm112 family protein [Phycisphaerae bacterium]|nr:Trm112 family protein [Phycisphaerae bacterium]
MSDQPTLDPALLQILVCPLTRSPLRQVGDELVAESGGLRYPVRDGIPVLLVDQARLPDGVTDLEEFRRRFADLIPRD